MIPKIFYHYYQYQVKLFLKYMLY